MQLAAIVKAANYMRQVNRYPASTVIYVDPSPDMLHRCGPLDREWLTAGAANAAIEVLWP